MTGARLVHSEPSAAWLPPGSTAEVWAGDDIEVPDPTVIVRLLLQRDTGCHRELFCVETPRGPDLPTRRLGYEEGLPQLLSEHLGGTPPTRCIGFVRNVVPNPGRDYAFPAPWAHVPVFTPRDPALTPGPGWWIGPDEAPALLAKRHWWLIACEALNWS
jgi:hypothetical protein